ncbi:MAG: MBL fold metallo-hydrolase, partial [Planctomycetaceae bacterium]|nr:MBL fold metallo-hydrolase [Planctomycetaceae bacterium]
DNHGRDRDRIISVARDVAGLKKIDHGVVSHWHRDHYGNHAALAAAFGIGTFWDRGIPDTLPEDKEFETRIAAYRAASQNASRPLKAGDGISLKSAQTPLSLRVLTSGREVVPNVGPVNPFADRHEEREHDPTDNAASLSLLLSFGEFRFLCCGDLTWNVEGRLVTPNNPVGTVDLFMVTHHGLPVSNNPALVLAIDPVVTVMCNGPTKGGAESTLKTLREVRSLQDMYQLHRNIDLNEELQATSDFIANRGSTETCLGRWIKASVAPDGKSYTVQIDRDGTVRTYKTRQNTVAAKEVRSN